MVAMTLLIVLIVLFWLIKSAKQSLLLFAHLFVGFVLLYGAMWLFKIPINTINIAAFPIVLGTGIDCFIHLARGYSENSDINETLRSKLPAVLISNLTTLVGFGGLFFVPSAGLRSLGWVILLGLGIMTLLCVFVLPRSLILTAGRQGRPVEKIIEA